MQATRRDSALPSRMAALLAASAERARDVRARAAVLSPLGMLVVCTLLAMLAAGAACASAWRDEHQLIEAGAAEAAERTDMALAEVERELDVVEALAAASSACEEPVRLGLAKAAIRSPLVREFYIEREASSLPCGAFGPVERAWTAAAASPGRTQVVPAEDLMGGFLVQRRFADHAIVAYVSPRQVMDRMPEGVNGSVIMLRTSDGWLLGQSGGTAASPLATVRRPVAARGLWIEMPVTRPRMLARLAEHASLWAIVWGLACVVAVVVANHLIAYRASRHRQLLTALRKRRFVPVVQPIVDARTGACLGAEILMRWKHPARGLVPPLEFIDYAERSGLIVPMAALLMRTARAQLTEIAAARPSLLFAFNVTPAQLRLPDFADSLVRIFDGEPIGPSRVVIELTERDLVDAQVRDQLAHLRTLGFRIAIDDFGTGQSSLALLQELPVDRLKVDREFVRTIEPGATEAPVLEAIIGLAHRLDLPLIAEGVETPQQRDWLRERGVQALQGYLPGRPMTVIDFGSWLARHDPAPERPLPDTDHDLAEVADALRTAPQLQRDRWYRLRRYRHCLLGSELVTWWSQTRGVSRAEAVRLGRRLVARGWLSHVHEEHDFEDGPFFYQLVSRQTQLDTAAPLPSDLPPTGQTAAWLHGDAGVRPGRRVRGLLLHHDAVSGREVVDALARAGQLSRERAVLCGRALLRAGRLRHVLDERGFVDSSSAHFFLA